MNKYYVREATEEELAKYERFQRWVVAKKDHLMPGGEMVETTYPTKDEAQLRAAKEESDLVVANDLEDALIDLVTEMAGVHNRPEDEIRRMLKELLS